MIDQQLYLDGELMDLSESTNIVLDIKSNLFRDVTKMTANSTYTIQLPKTAHNMAVLEFSGKPKTVSSYPYEFHTARYFRNGLEIINNGKASVLNVGESIEISIYWGLFHALTALQSSDLKLNELKTNRYLRFNKHNSPDKYDDAIKNGVFYADYNTAQVRKSTEEWVNYDITQGGNNTETFELTDGKIVTGETVGAYISGEVIEDASYRCTIVPFIVGQTATITSVLGKGEYRTWAVLDNNKNVLSLADEASDNKAQNINLQAPTTSAYIIVNAIKQYSSGTQLKIETKTEEDRTSRVSLYDDSSNVRSIGTIDNDGPIQPVVSCKYLLELISAETNVRFNWSDEANNVINSLAIPLVTRKADTNTLDGGIQGKFIDTRQLGILSFNLSKTASVVFNEGNETSQQLTLKVDCSLTIDVQMIWSWDASNVKPQGQQSWRNEDGTITTVGVYTYPPHYIEMKIVSEHRSDQEESEYTKTYIIGQSYVGYEGAANWISDYDTSMVNGRFIHLIAGRGTLDLAKGDIIMFELKHPANKTLYGLHCYNGTLNANIKQSDEVPYYGNYPIGKNLPEISVIEFIKTLCVLTVTFPMQNISAGTLRLTSIEGAFTKTGAKDWTKKLIPSTEANLPRQTDFCVENYCQHNLYKWKEDDTVIYNHDADMVIDNPTLEYSQDICKLPFAASDGNRVPIYEWQDVSVYFGDSKKPYTYPEATKYSACKDRIMNVYKNSAGYAALRFDIDLQGIFDNLTGLRKMISHPRQITERFRLSDIDILNFDETKPIYLAQYGCYFAVLEIKTTDNGYSEVTMIEIY